MHPIEMTPAALAGELRDRMPRQEAIGFLEHLLEYPALRNNVYDLIVETLQLLKKE